MLIPLLVVVAVLVLGVVLQRYVASKQPDAPTQPSEHVAPSQLDRSAFAYPTRSWLVAVFSSQDCSGCAEVWLRCQPLESDWVAVDYVEVSERPELHERYNITGVPTTVVADSDGVVQRYFMGNVSAADLWATVADVRAEG